MSPRIIPAAAVLCIMGITRLRKGIIGNIAIMIYLLAVFALEAKKVLYLTEGKMKYISLRLDLTRNMPAGKIISYVEEHENLVKCTMKKGAKARYIEVLFPAYYEAFTLSGLETPKLSVDILKSLDAGDTWPIQMHEIFLQIQNCRAAGMAAELFYIGKCYEMMSILLQMSQQAFPVKDITQKTLTTVAGMSASKLKLVFKMFTGKTITDFIHDKRISSARDYLIDSSLSIEEISQKTGFKTATGFATSFKKVTGTSPSEYRKGMGFSCIKNPSHILDLQF